jgi:2-phospho-L-lactate guanylyltransferase
MQARTAAVLPVKRFARAKQRLGEELSARARHELARAMVGDVLVALRDSSLLEGVVVVTAEPGVAAAASYQGALVVEDQHERGQSAAALLGVARALQEGFERVLLVPGDCPALDPAELDELLREPRAVVIVPDRHGTGTNGLLLAPPDAIEPAFGPGSFARHSALARAAGLQYAVERPATLTLDVDTGDDLRALRDRLAEHAGRAQRTRAVLERVLAMA